MEARLEEADATSSSYHYDDAAAAEQEQQVDKELDNTGAGGESTTSEYAYEQSQLLSADGNLLANYGEDSESNRSTTTSTVVHVNQGDRLSSDEIIVPLTLIWEAITPTNVTPWSNAPPNNYQLILSGNYADHNTGGWASWSKLYRSALVLESSLEVACSQYDIGAGFAGGTFDNPCAFLTVWPDVNTASSPYDKYRLPQMLYVVGAKTLMQPFIDNRVPGTNTAKDGNHLSVVRLQHKMSTEKIFGLRENQLDKAIYDPSVAAVPNKFWVWRFWWSFLPAVNVLNAPQSKLEIKITYLVKLMGRKQDIAPTNYNT
jgi:hypothetical protein